MLLLSSCLDKQCSASGPECGGKVSGNAGSDFAAGLASGHCCYSKYDLLCRAAGTATFCLSVFRIVKGTFGSLRRHEGAIFQIEVPLQSLKPKA